MKDHRVRVARQKEQWRRVSRLFKSVAWISVAAALLSEILVQQLEIEAQFHNDREMARAWVYVGLMYLVAGSLFFVKVALALSDYKMPYQPFGMRIALTLFGAVMCLMWIASPLAILTMGNDAVGRAHIFYIAFTHTIFGLALFGSLLFYTVAISMWLLFIGVPRFWTNSNKGV